MEFIEIPEFSGEQALFGEHHCWFKRGEETGNFSFPGTNLRFVVDHVRSNKVGLALGGVVTFVSYDEICSKFVPLPQLFAHGQETKQNKTG